MTDDPTVHAGDTPEEGPDRRDESIAGLLAVPPLDEHTRSRLVRRALDEVPAATSRWRRPALVLGAAAAVIAITVAGVALVAGGRGRPASTAARRAAGPHPAAGPAAPGSEAQLPPRDLGAVGDITDPARLRRVVGGPAQAPGASLDRIGQACGSRAVVAGLTRLDTVAVGVDRGRPAGVVVGRDAAGRRRVVVVSLAGCAPLQRLALG